MRILDAVPDVSMVAMQTLNVCMATMQTLGRTFAPARFATASVSSVA